jgi:hypothetical protein
VAAVLLLIEAAALVAGLGAVMQQLKQHLHQQEQQHQRQHQHLQFHNLNNRAQMLEQHIEMAMQHLNEPSFWPAEVLQAGVDSSSCLQDNGGLSGSEEPKYCSIVLLQSLFEPAWVDQVCLAGLPACCTTMLEQRSV